MKRGKRKTIKETAPTKRRYVGCEHTSKTYMLHVNKAYKAEITVGIDGIVCWV